MNGSKTLQLVVVTGLLVVSFVLGRMTVQAPVEEPALAPNKSKAPKRLTAINPDPVDRPKDKVARSAPTQERPAGSAQDWKNADHISAFLAEVAGSLDDLSALAEILADWMAEDPESAIAWLATSERDDVLRPLFHAWGRNQPAEATAWLAANQNLAGYNSAAVGLAFARSIDSETALALADTVTDPVAKAQIWEISGENLYSSNQDELRERLANTGFPEEIQTGLIQKWRIQINNKSKRNAQNIASVYSSALAAGATFRGTTKEEIAVEITEGINGADSFKDTRFQIPNMQAKEIERALRNLNLDGTSLNYEGVDQDDL